MPATTRRLYRVEATYEYFVIADDEYDALDSLVLAEVTNDAIDPDSHTAVLDDGTANPLGWGPQSLVYSVSSDDEDMTLEEARERLGGDSDG